MKKLSKDEMKKVLGGNSILKKHHVNQFGTRQSGQVVGR